MDASHHHSGQDNTSHRHSGQDNTPLRKLMEDPDFNRSLLQGNHQPPHVPSPYPAHKEHHGHHKEHHGHTHHHEHEPHSKSRSDHADAHSEAPKEHGLSSTHKAVRLECGGVLSSRPSQTSILDEGEIPIYFKLQQKVRKAVFNVANGDLESLQDLFFRTFRDVIPPEEIPSGMGEKIQLFPMFTYDSFSHIFYEVEGIQDIERNSVIEVKMRQSVHNPVIRSLTGGMEMVCDSERKIVFALVGLPARGKTYVANHVSRYLKWLGVRTKVFHVADYRRQKVGLYQNTELWDDTIKEHRNKMVYMYSLTIDDMLGWLKRDGQVAIMDATNINRHKRGLVSARCQAARVAIVFIECISDNEDVIMQNIRQMHLQVPDFKGLTLEEVVENVNQRIAHRTEIYEPVSNEEGSYIRMFDMGRKIHTYHLTNYLSQRITFFLTNLQTSERSIYLTRHGQSEYNAQDRVGGDAPLTQKGQEYAERLSKWIGENLDITDSNLQVWTSCLKRACETAKHINLPKLKIRALDEIDTGDCDGMTYSEIAEKLPHEYSARISNKFSYRYPRGESYADLIQRLEPVVFELERQKNPIIIVGHQAVLRCIYSYFMDIPQEQIPFVPMPLHCITKLTPRAYDYQMEKFQLLDSC
eukprot:CAMPEP_0177667658 /NCGR_PEP_ID=MMETSP0447-20121125/22246_1 /TAXON_ID=0 /ORGANISM="Stygamoeba regulata, Strain BSH-02190019" /LENGTH=638 /DNA_ID=CAMNT_0019173915 /DNA_START=19 /DNA_END=1935 /DNA_ORIENTATION=+